MRFSGLEALPFAIVSINLNSSFTIRIDRLFINEKIIGKYILKIEFGDDINRLSKNETIEILVEYKNTEKQEIIDKTEFNNHEIQYYEYYEEKEILNDEINAI